MGIVPPGEAERVRAIGRLVYVNPFLPERVELERTILGDTAAATRAVWHPSESAALADRNLGPIGARARELAEEMRRRLRERTPATSEETELYQDLCLYVLFDRTRAALVPLLPDDSETIRRGRVAGWDEFAALFARYFDESGRAEGTRVAPPHGHTPARLFACFFQVVRAFRNTFFCIVGGSLPAARLRSQVWQSVFTHDLRRYQRALCERMGDVTTLVTGPSGAGKELVARAIARARFIPFDPESRTFQAGTGAAFLPLNLSALSPTLVESELFGHRRGAFTGAVADRQGWLETCPATGTVFLDEIGEIDPALQVKLLRVLENRTFQPLGSSDDRRFRGKIVAATNRDLGREMQAGRFREDLYYRLCADTIVVPSLRERLADRPEELRTLVSFLAERLVGADEAASLTEETHAWIRAHLGDDYAWPGNIRELAHCVSNVMIHADYRPAARQESRDAATNLAAEIASGELSADAVLRRYCSLVFARTGSYVKAAERLGLDRRTVKAHVDPGLVASPRGDGAKPQVPAGSRRN